MGERRGKDAVSELAHFRDAPLGVLQGLVEESLRLPVPLVER